jgi:threonine dehydratase
LWQQAFAINGPPGITPDTIADGTSAPFDPVMFERLGSLVHEWVVVPEMTMRQTIARIAVDLKVVAEGAGALAYAAMLDGRSSPRTVAILSGGNIDGSRLAELLTE